MTDTDIKLDFHNRSPKRSHDKDHADDGSYENHDDHDHHVPRPYGHRPMSHGLTVQRRINLLIRHVRSYREIYLVALPTLYFRLFPLIFTHNSTPLSIYLAVVLVYIPAKVILAAWQAYFSSSYASKRRKRRSSFLLPSNGPSSSSNASSSKNGRAGLGGEAAQSLLWLCGALFTLWAYTWGISSPFPSAASIVASSPTLQDQQARNASYFIAASFWNNEDILDSWTAQALQLIDALGRPNVYVSLTENDSDDNTASKLLHFGRELTRRHVAHSVNITMDLRGYPPENPWHSIKHRMGYMANLRNGALEPLGRLNRRFENVVILNDIVYHHTDILKLIAAVGGDDVHASRAKHSTSHQAPKPGKRRMACSIDMDGATVYDTWVLRDRCGRPVSGFWPFFTAEDDKRAVREERVLPVGTCWNGIVVLDGDMLLEPPLRSKRADWDADTLRFQQPPECIVSECALLPLSITNTTGGAPIVMDPSVIVGYSVQWWRYYAVWLRMPIVRLWMRVFEEGYWGLWWTLGMGKGLRWTGLDNGKEKNECVVSGWPACESNEYAVKGGIRFGN